MIRDDRQSTTPDDPESTETMQAFGSEQQLGCLTFFQSAELLTVEEHVQLGINSLTSTP